MEYIEKNKNNLAALYTCLNLMNEDWATDELVEAADGYCSPFLPTGTRIIYDRKFLLECRSSPVTKTPPKGLPVIPGVTSPPSGDPTEKTQNGELLNNNNIPAPEGSNTGMFRETLQGSPEHCFLRPGSIYWFNDSIVFIQRENIDSYHRHRWDTP